MNKKGQLWKHLFGAIVLILLLVFVAYQLAKGIGMVDGSIDELDLLGREAGSPINANDPCPCTEGTRRVTVDDVLYCATAEQITQEQCNRFGFNYDSTQGCYYTREQCLLYLRS